MGVTVQLYCGDCLEILPTLEAGSVGVMVTDPPYGVSKGTWVNKQWNEPCIIGETRRTRASNRVITREDVAVRDTALKVAACRAVVFGSWRAPRPIGTRMRIVWDKGFVGLGGFGPWRPADEEIYIIGTGWVNSRNTPTVIQHSPVGNANRNHPNEKPVELLLRILGWCQPEWTILDPFMGSGTTGVACVQTGRNFIGIEISEEYFKIAEKRIAEAQAQLHIPFDSMSLCGDSSRIEVASFQSSLPSLGIDGSSSIVDL